MCTITIENKEDSFYLCLVDFQPVEERMYICSLELRTKIFSVNIRCLIWANELRALKEHCDSIILSRYESFRFKPLEESLCLMFYLKDDRIGIKGNISDTLFPPNSLTFFSTVDKQELIKLVHGIEIVLRSDKN